MLYIKSNLQLNIKPDVLFDGYVEVQSEIPNDRLIVCQFSTDKENITREVVFDSSGKGQVYFKVTEEVIKSKNLYLSIGVFNYEDFTFSNRVPVNLNPMAVARVRQNEDEFKNLRFEIFELKQQVLDYINGLEYSINIPPSNKDNLRKGMVLSVIDNLGHVAFKSLYDDSIKEINGVKAYNYQVRLESKNIPHQNITVEDAIKNLNGVAKAIQTNYENLLETVQEVIKRLAELEVKFVEYTSRDIL